MLSGPKNHVEILIHVKFGLAPGERVASLVNGSIIYSYIKRVSLRLSKISTIWKYKLFYCFSEVETIMGRAKREGSMFIFSNFITKCAKRRNKNASILKFQAVHLALDRS